MPAAASMPRLRLRDWTSTPLPLAVTPAGGGRVALHCHEFYELVYVRAGVGTNVIEDRPYPMVRGDVLLMRPDDVHSYAGDADNRLFNVLFMPELFAPGEWQDLLALPGLRPFLAGSGRTRPSAPHKLALIPADARRAEALCERMRAELATPAPGHTALARALLVDFLVLLARAQVAYGGLAVHGAAADGPVARALAIVHRDCRAPHSVAGLAAAVGLTANWFGERFQQVTGLTLRDYVLRLRLEEARRLIEDSDASLTAVALDAGFNDPSYFARVFRRATGLTPRAYRRLVRGRGSGTG